MIKQRFIDSMQHLRRDALAGSVAGIMAVPLTVGICLMSDYPVMTGLYTVIFATIISYLAYLVRPGNYVGTPGVAAGLAPALALGVSVFGMENMPFVIFLTAIFQMIVWRYKLEKYILKLVPHYLVEGLLAGVGLKIALKFLPFLYDIQHETDEWLNLERELILILSAVSFVMFVLLYKYYQKKMPALPYIVIMTTGFGLTFFMPLPLLTIEDVPFELVLPLPHFGSLSGSEAVWLIAKMVGYAMMLGTIDVIEQVMSNVAIEKLDPLKRKCDSNNSLLAIWVANMGATFFGGMTNLDGLAKSTTNAVAGAITKTSNLFTALVLILVVFFPEILAYTPEYALGIIMVYSGWKMIANIAHVRAEGRYALILAGVCGFLVFEFGIFEGLLLVLFGHAIIQYIFMRRLGKSTKQVWATFRIAIREKKLAQLMDLEDVLTEDQIPVLTKWLAAMNKHDIKLIKELYTKGAVFTPAFSSNIHYNIDEIEDYYKYLFSHEGVYLKKLDLHMQKHGAIRINSGHYGIGWIHEGKDESHVLRFCMVVEKNKIVTHHTSTLPTGDVPLNKWLGARDPKHPEFII
ncbi:MAG: SulP family inorganic anion transporter [Salibacteraceae bacterium]|nr:SulP family inorganic anion transporter [Salibacteraceae bacterium]